MTTKCGLPSADPGGTAHVARFALSDIRVSGRELRIYDLLLAERLGFEHARNIRRLIKGNLPELESHGDIVAADDRSGGTGNMLPAGANPKAGRPGKAYHLNEGQALVLCALARTPTAAQVRRELIRVFMKYRAMSLSNTGGLSCGDLEQAERRALRDIVETSDIVKAPMIHAEHRFACDDEGYVTYLLAPVTSSILDTLSEFEAGAADSEEDDHGGGDVVDERHDEVEEGTLEPTLGSPAHTIGNNTKWADGGDTDERETCDDREMVNEDGGDINDEPHDEYDQDLEPDADGEHSLGSVATAHNANQEHWAQANDAGENELVNEDGLHDPSYLTREQCERKRVQQAKEAEGVKRVRVKLDTMVRAKRGEPEPQGNLRLIGSLRLVGGPDGRTYAFSPVQ